MAWRDLPPHSRFQRIRDRITRSRFLWDEEVEALQYRYYDKHHLDGHFFSWIRRVGSQYERGRRYGLHADGPWTELMLTIDSGVQRLRPRYAIFCRACGGIIKSKERDPHEELSFDHDKCLHTRLQWFTKPAPHKYGSARGENRGEPKCSNQSDEPCSARCKAVAEWLDMSAKNTDTPPRRPNKYSDLTYWQQGLKQLSSYLDYQARCLETQDKA